MIRNLLTVKQAAHREHVTEAAIYLAVKEGRLKSVRVLERIAIKPADLKAWTQTSRAGRPKGMPVSQEVRARISQAQKERWKRRKQDEKNQKKRNEAMRETSQSDRDSS